jgi:hypothetical protein
MPPGIGFRRDVLRHGQLLRERGLVLGNFAAADEFGQKLGRRRGKKLACDFDPRYLGDNAVGRDRLALGIAAYAADPLSALRRV